MNKKMLALGILAMVSLPSCMHPVEQVLNARADQKIQNLQAQGTVSQGACDDVGQIAAKWAGLGLTLDLARDDVPAVTASAHALR